MGRRFYDTTLIMAGKICPYCGQPTEYVDSAAVYHGISYGMIYLCRKCDAYVGVHRGTDKALGRLANRSLREWKKRAHYYFDPISRTPLINRMWPMLSGPTAIYVRCSSVTGLWPSTISAWNRPLSSITGTRSCRLPIFCTGGTTSARAVGSGVTMIQTTRARCFCLLRASAILMTSAIAQSWPARVSPATIGPRRWTTKEATMRVAYI